MTCAGMLRFTRHYKDTIQERLTILVLVCSKFIRVYTCQIELGLTKLLQKIKGCSFFDSQCTSADMDMDMDMDRKFHIHGKPGY